MNLRTEYLVAVGNLAVSFQSLESVIRLFAAGLVAEDQKLGLICTAQLSFQRLCQLLEALLRLRSTSEARIAKLQALMKRAASAEEKRNALFHCTWLTADPVREDEPWVARVKVSTKTGKGLKVDFQTVKPGDLTAVAAEFSGLTIDVMQLYSECRDAGEAWLPTEPTADPPA